MKILVTGGAGYIGSHTCRLLVAEGHEVWIYDNLSRGHRAAALPGRLVEGELADRALVEQTLREKQIDAVMHFAAFALVGESVTQPHLYYGNNLVGTFQLLEALRATGVNRFVFSSTTATYGTPEKMPIAETTPQAPINPYGFTKLCVERMLDDYAAAYGLAFASLRYFNAAGASLAGGIGEDHTPESHLIPLVLQVALGQRETISIFGNDYPTPDGTCVRDYIHVDDLADAHLRALVRLKPDAPIKVNLGSGRGFSVQEVIDVCRRVTGHAIPAEIAPRRPGDPPELIADNRLARELLGWVPRHSDLETIVRSAWKWHQSHPRGYPKA